MHISCRVGDFAACAAMFQHQRLRTILIDMNKSLKYGEIWGVLACMAFPDFAYNFSSFVVSSETIYLGSFKTLNSSQEVT